MFRSSLRKTSVFMGDSGFEGDDRNRTGGSSRSSRHQKPLQIEVFVSATNSPLVAELRELVQRIALKSQVSAASLGRATPSTDDEIGGKRPGGGIDGADDWSDEADGYWLKSGDYFQRRLGRILRGYSSRGDLRDAMLRLLISEAEETLKRWERSPLDAQRPASMSDPKWGLFVALSKEDAGTLARWYGCSRQHIYATRKKWRDAG